MGKVSQKVEIQIQALKGLLAGPNKGQKLIEECQEKGFLLTDEIKDGALKGVNLVIYPRKRSIIELSSGYVAKEYGDDTTGKKVKALNKSEKQGFSDWRKSWEQVGWSWANYEGAAVSDALMLGRIDLANLYISRGAKVLGITHNGTSNYIEHWIKTGMKVYGPPQAVALRKWIEGLWGVLSAKERAEVLSKMVMKLNSLRRHLGPEDIKSLSDQLLYGYQLAGSPDLPDEVRLIKSPWGPMLKSKQEHHELSELIGGGNKVLEEEAPVKLGHVMAPLIKEETLMRI